MKELELPTQQYLKECFDYDKETGSLTWKKRPIHHFKNKHGMNTFNSKYAGSEIKSMVNDRYLVVRIASRSYLLHRVIWVLITGTNPSSNIDHIDTDKTNNRFENLREATKKENAFNQNLSKRNKTGYKGVSYDSERGMFFSCIRLEGKTKYLGRFSTPEQASLAYVREAKDAHGAFFRGKE